MKRNVRVPKMFFALDCRGWLLANNWSKRLSCWPVVRSESAAGSADPALINSPIYYPLAEVNTQRLAAFPIKIVDKAGSSELLLR